MTMPLTRWMEKGLLRRRCDELWKRCYDECGHLYPKWEQCVLDCHRRNHVHEICRKAYGECRG